MSEWLFSAKSLDELLLVTRRAMTTLFPAAGGCLYIHADTCDTLEVVSAWGDKHPFFCLPIVADGETIGMLHLRFTSVDLSVTDRTYLETFLHQRW